MLIVSLLNLFLSFLPVLIYLGIIYITIPYGSIDFRKTLTYLFCGIISISLIMSFLGFFPHFQEYVYPPFQMLDTNDSDKFFIQAFIQIAFLEEFMKFIGFFIGKKMDKTPNLPIATMFYCGVVALGMSFMENFQYASFGGTSLIFVRSVATMIMHFTCGLIMGYWIALSRMESSQKGSIIGVFMNKFKWLRGLLFSACGIFFAASIHGIFDYNLMFEGNPVKDVLMILILMIGIFITYICGRNLIGKTNQD